MQQRWQVIGRFGDIIQCESEADARETASRMNRIGRHGGRGAWRAIRAA